jgi:hypothetical protein
MHNVHGDDSCLQKVVVRPLQAFAAVHSYQLIGLQGNVKEEAKS